MRGNPVNRVDPLGLADLVGMQFPESTVAEGIDEKPNNPDEFSIVAHGAGPKQIVIGNRRMTALELFGYIRSDRALFEKLRRAKYAKLYSCNSGHGTDSVAEQFANVSGMPSFGPEEQILFTPNMATGITQTQVRPYDESVTMSTSDGWRRFDPSSR